MKILKSSLLSSLFLVLVISVSGQRDFSDLNVDYTFTLPNDTWKMTVRPSEVSPNVEFVYGTKNRGHLEVRKLRVEANTLFGEMIKDEEQKESFRDGYVAGPEENFKGNLSGRVYNFEYVSSGRNMSGRYYFLRSGAHIVYLLRFKGYRDDLRAIRAQTDSIARTFDVKSRA